MDRLPIDDALPELLEALRVRRRAVLQAPPGAGKTTRVPLAIDAAGLSSGRIVMLEPRRLAARAAAHRMAATLGEAVGDTVGYRIRGETRVSRRSRIEVVTEGILTRMIQSDPGLDGIGTVIFDEFHERSLNADLGLALCLEIAGALREDLLLLAMSATLDSGPVAELMQAPAITSEGRGFPVETRWRDRPVPREMRFETAMADLVAEAAAAQQGGVLAFLPGEAEIRRTEALLRARLPEDHRIRPLYGALPFDRQQEAIAPETGGRKIVLATAIAETSLTIEDIRVVVDGGRARRARFDPGSGMTRLVTEPVSRAEAVQRAGRAGRVAPGLALRLWTRGQEGALAPHAPAEIETADLAPLALELALWGAAADQLAFVTPPNPAALAEARALLRDLGALDRRGAISAHGRLLAAIPAHPRIAHMLAVAGPGAAPLAALLEARDPLRGAPVDLTLRLDALRRGGGAAHDIPAGVRARLRDEARRLAARAPKTGKADLGPAEMAALAYPDRIGLRRSGDAPRYVLSGGKGAVLPAEDPLAGARFIVVTDTDGNPREARIRLAIAIGEAALRDLFADALDWHETCRWSRRERRVIARRQLRLGAIALEDHVWTDAPAATLAAAMLDGVRELGLSPDNAARRLAARVRIGREGGLDLPDMPDMSEEALMADLQTWLLPFLDGVTTAAEWKRFDLLPALRARLDWAQTQALDAAVPAQFVTPLGRRIAIDYSGDHPEIALRLQELFGQTTHPTVGGTPLRVTLLSPAQRPVQTTMDLPGFWAGSYADVRKDMRARYPRHPWPEDPTQADPTLRAKRRG